MNVNFDPCRHLVFWPSAKIFQCLSWYVSCWVTFWKTKLYLQKESRGGGLKGVGVRILKLSRPFWRSRTLVRIFLMTPKVASHEVVPPCQISGKSLEPFFPRSKCGNTRLECHFVPSLHSREMSNYHCFIPLPFNKVATPEGFRGLNGRGMNRQNGVAPLPQLPALPYRFHTHLLPVFLMSVQSEWVSSPRYFGTLQSNFCGGR